MKTKSVLMLIGLAVTVAICNYFVKNADNTDNADRMQTETTASAAPDTVTDMDVSSNAPSEAEQMYTSLYNRADFERYICFDLGYDVDMDDMIYIEGMRLPAGQPDEVIGTSYKEPYCRIASGRLSSSADFTEWVDSFASGSYVANIFSASSSYVVKYFSDYFRMNFAISDGRIYVPYHFTQYDGGWGYNSPLTLEGVTVLYDDMIQLKLSYTEYGIDIGSMEPEKVSLTVEMSRDNGRGWRIAAFDPAYRVPLINQFFRNEFLVDSGEPDLLTQLENYLAENPMS